MKPSRFVAALTLSALAACALVQAQGGPTTAEKYKVDSLPGLSQEDAAGLEQYAGHIALDAQAESKLFFWMVSSKHKQEDKNSKLVIWLNGGPGCSSADGFFLENGPLRFVDGQLTINKGGWHEFATMVFLDQPVGTGLSFTRQQLRENLEEISSDFVDFLKAFFTVFPDRSQDDLYLAGESYAGTYIPYFSKAILDWNDQANEGDITFQLKGAAIGNGWIDPVTQYNSYVPYVEHHKIGDAALIDEMNAQMDVCNNDIQQRNLITQDSCERIVQIVIQNSQTKEGDDTMCINQYDTRLKDRFPACGLLWPNELPLMKNYLGRVDVLTALHASEAPQAWTECQNRVASALQNDLSPPATGLLPEILKRINLLLFSGDKDLICNHIGTEYLIGNLTWNGATGFENPTKHTWTVDGKPAGEWTESRNLTYVLFSDASHMVPYDAPLAAMDMMNRFMELDPTLQPFVSKLDVVPTGTDDQTMPEDPTQPEDSEVSDDESEGGDNDGDEDGIPSGGQEDGELDNGNDGVDDDDDDNNKQDDQQNQEEHATDDEQPENNDGDESQEQKEDPTNNNEQEKPQNGDGDQTDNQGLPESPDNNNAPSSPQSSGPSGSMMLPLLMIGVGAAFFMYRRRANKVTPGHNGTEWFPLHNQDSARSSPAPGSHGRGGFVSPPDELDELVVESGLRRESFEDDESDEEPAGRPRRWQD